MTLLVSLLAYITSLHICSCELEMHTKSVYVVQTMTCFANKESKQSVTETDIYGVSSQRYMYTSESCNQSFPGDVNAAFCPRFIGDFH